MISVDPAKLDSAVIALPNVVHVKQMIQAAHAKIQNLLVSASSWIHQPQHDHGDSTNPVGSSIRSSATSGSSDGSGNAVLVLDNGSSERSTGSSERSAGSSECSAEERFPTSSEGSAEEASGTNGGSGKMKFSGAAETSAKDAAAAAAAVGVEMDAEDLPEELAADLLVSDMKWVYKCIVPLFTEILAG